MAALLPRRAPAGVAGGTAAAGAAAAGARPGRGALRVWAGNKLIRAPAPTSTGKVGNAPKRAAEVNLQRLVSDASFVPERLVGPVEVAPSLPGRGRGVIAKEDVAPGALLFVSEPIGSVATGSLGQQLQAADLLQHWQQRGLAAADKFKLGMLHAPGSAPPPAVSFRSFAADKAAAKAKKAAASSKGFAKAGKPAAAGGAAASGAASGAAELSEAQLQQLVAVNAFGEDHTDAALTHARREQQRSVVGVWPEFALLNHSCCPNTAAPVLLADRLLLRAAVPVPAGEELTSSYLGLAGGLPRPQRQQLLDSYGFSCSCHRCKAEAAAPADVQATLQAAHEWSRGVDPSRLLALMAADDSAGVSNIQQQAQGLVDQLEQQLGQVAEPVAKAWLRASMHDTLAICLRTTDWLNGLTDEHAARRLAELVQVFSPGSEPHLLLLADSAARAADAARRGEAPAADADPGDTQERRVQQMVRALTLRYGEPRSLEVLRVLADALVSSLAPAWLGLVDLDGSMGLQPALAASTRRAGGERRRVELDITQLGSLQASS